jgi:hypothetical protein
MATNYQKKVMPDLKLNIGLKVKESAISAMAQIHDQLDDAVIAIIDHPPNACCQIGFNAIPVSRSKISSTQYSGLGMYGDMEIMIEKNLLTAEITKITLGFDHNSGTLIAYME